MPGMALDLKSTDITKIGSIEINLLMGASGVDIAYGFEGISKDAAIGYLQTVQDRMREERKYEWHTCPECHQPWAAHFGTDEDEDFDDDDYDEEDD